MLIESAMPTFDTVIAEDVVVAADPSTTFHAARTLDLLTVRTPLLAVSMWIRGLPERWSGKAAPPLPRLVVADGSPKSPPGQPVSSRQCQRQLVGMPRSRSLCPFRGGGYLC
jgi:hypothetical protein